jgi:squalene-hopene/tetraprenyl-beta-curcumene cyclase
LCDQVAATNVNSLDFTQLVWCMIALSSVGYSADSTGMNACNTRLEGLLYVDEQLDRISPQLHTTSVSDTLVSLVAVRDSGVGTNHPCVTEAIRFLSRFRRQSSTLAQRDITVLLRLLAASPSDADDYRSVLPPNIEMRAWRDDGRPSAATRFANRVSPLVESLVTRVLRQQSRNGSWGTVHATAEVLEAIGRTDCAKPQSAFHRALAYLRSAQQGDGSWNDEFDTPSVLATSSAVRGLIAAGVPTDDELIHTGINWLVVYQRPDGGWDEPSSATSTAIALSALAAAGRPNSAAALRAVQFLTESQDDRGGWVENGPTSHNPASGRYSRNDLHATALTLSALSQWAVAAASAQPATADKPSLNLVGAATEN